MTCARSSRIEKKVTRMGRLRALLLSFILSVTKIPVVVDLCRHTLCFSSITMGNNTLR